MGICARRDDLPIYLQARTHLMRLPQGRKPVTRTHGHDLGRPRRSRTGLGGRFHHPAAGRHRHDTRFTILLHLPDGHDAEHVSRPSSTRCSTCPNSCATAPDLGPKLALHKRIGASVYFWTTPVAASTSCATRHRPIRLPGLERPATQNPRLMRRENLNNRQRDHGRPSPPVLQPPLGSAIRRLLIVYILSICCSTMHTMGTNSNNQRRSDSFLR